MASLWVEEELEFPAEIVENSLGMSLDIGGSVVKVVYRSKEEYDKGVPKNGTKGKGKGTLHILHCSRQNLDAALDYVTQQCDWLKDGDNSSKSLYTTGVGANFFHAKLIKELGVSIDNELEFECFSRAIHYMCSHLPQENLFHPESKKGLDKAQPIMDFFFDFEKKVAKFSEATIEGSLEEKEKRREDAKTKKSEDVSGPPEPLLPAILCICGSAVAILKVEEDGEFKVPDFAAGGATFLGLAKLLTGEGDFDKVIQMAEEGDTGLDTTVDVYGKEIKSGHEDGYAAFPDDIMVFPFGKLVTEDLAGVKKEDLAFSLLNIMCLSFAQAAHMHAVTCGISNLYFCGNFVNKPLVRQIVTTCMTIRNFSRPPGIPSMNFQFVRAGGHLGALGAYMKSSIKDKSSK